MVSENEDAQDIKEIQDCVNGLCQNAKSKSSVVRNVVRGILGILAPMLVKSPDPRIKALGLAMGVLRETVYKKR